jgi:hypothetical protein
VVAVVIGFGGAIKGYLDDREEWAVEKTHLDTNCEPAARLWRDDGYTYVYNCEGVMVELRDE